MTKPANPAAGIAGTRIDPKTGEPVNMADEREHFYVCPSCGQAVDMRDLGAVFHHEEPGHEPLPADG